MNIERLIRPNVRTLIPYRSARSQHLEGLLLDANENAFGSASSDGPDDLHRYPDPYQRTLRARIASLEGVAPASVFTGVGSDEVIDLLIRVVCEPRLDSILVVEPTYGMYRVAAGVHDVRVDSVLLKGDFQLDPSAVVRAVVPGTKLVFCCSPNNPTGNLLRRKDLLALCASSDAIVVVDEAYIDFSEGPSLAGDVARTPNLVVLKTLSKSWGLAGIRLGYCLANPSLISYLDKIKPPYNINTLTSEAALNALRTVDRRDTLVRQVRSERERLASALQGLSFVERVYPSDANFLLVRCADHTGLLSYLVSRGIIIRDRSTQPGLNRCVRITVGTPSENERLLETLKDFERD